MNGVAALVRAVLATTVALGLATGTGPLVDPLSAALGVGRGATSSLFSLTLFVMLGSGLVAGPLAGRWGVRRLALLGAVLVPLGTVVLASTDAVAVAALGLAVGVGGGAGCLFVPLLAAVGAAFERRRSVALVLATAGGGLGTVITPPVVAALLDAHGLRATLLLLAAGSAPVLLACAATAGGRPATSAAAGEPGAVVVLRERSFRRLCLASVGVCAAMFVPFVHLAPDATARGLDAAVGAGLVAATGAASTVGRVAVIPAVARWGSWPVYRAAALVLTAACGVWLLAGGRAGWLVAFAVVFGVAHGAWVGLGGAVAAERHGPVGLAARLGALHAAAAVGGLVGPAAAGWAVQVAGTPAAAPAVAALLGAVGCAGLARVGRPDRVVDSGEPAARQPLAAGSSA